MNTMNGMDQRIGPFRSFQFQDKGGKQLEKLLSGEEVGNQKIELGEVVVHLEHLMASQSGIVTYSIVVQRTPQKDETIVLRESDEPKKKPGRPKKQTFELDNE